MPSFSPIHIGVRHTAADCATRYWRKPGHRRRNAIAARVAFSGIIGIRRGLGPVTLHHCDSDIDETDKFRESNRMQTTTKAAIVVAGLTAGSMFGASTSYASGDAPWCAITEIGEGANQMDCQYETVQECLPSVLSGNRGHCSPNPYAVDRAPVSAPSATAPISTTPATAGNRKAQERAR